MWNVSQETPGVKEGIIKFLMGNWEVEREEFSRGRKVKGIE